MNVKAKANDTNDNKYNQLTSLLLCTKHYNMPYIVSVGLYQGLQKLVL